MTSPTVVPSARAANVKALQPTIDAFVVPRFTDFIRSDDVYTEELPALNGCFTARGLARMYSVLARGGVDPTTGERYLTEATLRLYPRLEHVATVLVPFETLDAVTAAVPRIVDRGVEVEVGGRQSLAVHGGKVRERSVLAQTSMQLADAPTAREVVHPHGRTERAGDLAGHHTVLRENRDHEGEHVHQVGCVAAEPLPFVQCLVDEADVALLQVPESAVDQLRGLGRCAGGEVVTLHECGGVAPAGRVKCCAGTRDAAAHHEDVEGLVLEAAQGLGAVEGVRHGGQATRPPPRPPKGDRAGRSDPGPGAE